MKKLTILCDVDEILANLIEAWLKAYNTKFNRNVNIASIRGKAWGIEHYVPDGTAIFTCLDTPGLFANLEPLPGALETLTRLRNKGHEILIVTASAKTPQVAADKIIWLKKNLSWFTQDDFFLGRKKYKIKGDVLIDDAPHNIRAYREHWPNAQILTIGYEYNECIKGLVNCYAESYKDTVSAWKQMEAYIDNLAEQIDLPKRKE